MGYKKQEWFGLNRNGIMFELVVRDQDFKRLETNKFTPQNFTKTMKDVGNRYGIDEEKLVPNKDFEEEMEWLKKEKII